MAAGILATASAFITIGYMYWAARVQRRRRLAACRAMLPVDLSAVTGYVQGCMAVIFQAFERLKEPSGTPKQPLVLPVMPERVFENIQAVVEQSDRRGKLAFSELLSCYQIQRARLSGEIADLNNPYTMGATKVTTESNIESTILKTAELYLIASKLFPFSRRQARKIPPLKYTGDEVENVFSILWLNEMRFSEGFLEDLKEKLATSSG